MPTKRRSAKRTRRVKVKKGGYYSFNGAVGTGAPNWTRESELGDASISSRGNNAQYGRGRKRKGGKKNKTMRGGTKFGQVSATFQGTGARGMADAIGVSVNKPGFATQGEFNNFGAQPGSGHASFITAGK